MTVGTNQRISQFFSKKLYYYVLPEYGLHPQDLYCATIFFFVKRCLES